MPLEYHKPYCGTCAEAELRTSEFASSDNSRSVPTPLANKPTTLRRSRNNMTASLAICKAGRRSSIAQHFPILAELDHPLRRTGVMNRPQSSGIRGQIATLRNCESRHRGVSCRARLHRFYIRLPPVPNVHARLREGARWNSQNRGATCKTSQISETPKFEPSLSRPERGGGGHWSCASPVSQSANVQTRVHRFARNSVFSAETDPNTESMGKEISEGRSAVT